MTFGKKEPFGSRGRGTREAIHPWPMAVNRDTTAEVLAGAGASWSLGMADPQKVARPGQGRWNLTARGHHPGVLYRMGI